VSVCHVFFFIDACGAEVVRPYPAFTDLAPRWQSLRSVFGYSSACVPSILSGLYPEQHLHWSFFQRPVGRPGIAVPWWIKALPRMVRDRGRVRNQLSKAVARHNGITGYFQLYQMPLEQLHRYAHCEPRDIFSPGGLNQGTTFIDTLAATPIHSWVADWHKTEADNWQHMESQAADRRSGVLFMYAASLDAWLHDHTRQHAGLETELRLIRSHIERVLAVAKANHDEVFWHMFSDHGMCTVDRHVQVLPLLERTGLRMHIDYQCVVDSTMVRLWCDDPGHRTLLRDALATCREIRLLDHTWLAKEHCAFPDDRFGQDIWLADPGVLLVPSHMGSTPLAAMHGYDPAHADTDASYLTNVPTSQPSDIVGINKLIHQAIADVHQASGAKA